MADEVFRGMEPIYLEAPKGQEGTEQGQVTQGQTDEAAYSRFSGLFDNILEAASKVGEIQDAESYGYKAEERSTESKDYDFEVPTIDIDQATARKKAVFDQYWNNAGIGNIEDDSVAATALEEAMRTGSVKSLNWGVNAEGKAVTPETLTEKQIEGVDSKSVLSDYRPDILPQEEVDQNYFNKMVNATAKGLRETARNYLPSKSSRKLDVVQKFRDKYTNKNPNISKLPDEEVFKRSQELADSYPQEFGEFKLEELKSLSDFKEQNPKYKDVDDKELYDVLNKHQPGVYAPPGKNIAENIKYAFSTALAASTPGQAGRHGMPYMYSIAEGLAHMSGGLARVPALAVEMIYCLPYNLIAKPAGYLQKQTSEEFFNNVFAREADYIAENVSYIQKEFKGEDLASLVADGDATRVVSYLTHQVAVNSPNHIMTMGLALAGLGSMSGIGAGAVEAAHAMKEAREKGVDPLSSQLYALESGAFEMAFEGMGSGRILTDSIKMIKKVYGSKAARKVAKSVFYVMLNNMFGGGSEEFCTSLAQDFAAYANGVDPNYSVKGSLKRAVEAFFIGFVSEGTMTNPTAIYNATTANARGLYKNIQETQDAFDGVEDPAVDNIKDNEIESTHEIDDDGKPYGVEEVMNNTADSLNKNMQDKYDSLASENKERLDEIEGLKANIKELGFGEGTIEVKEYIQNQIDDIEDDMRVSRETMRQDEENLLSDIQRAAVERARDKGIDLGKDMDAWQDFVGEVMSKIDLSRTDAEMGKMTVNDIVDQVIDQYKASSEKSSGKDLRSLSERRDAALRNLENIKKWYNFLFDAWTGNFQEIINFKEMINEKKARNYYNKDGGAEELAMDEIALDILSQVENMSYDRLSQELSDTKKELKEAWDEYNAIRNELWRMNKGEFFSDGMKDKVRKNTARLKAIYYKIEEIKTRNKVNIAPRDDDDKDILAEAVVGYGEEGKTSLIEEAKKYETAEEFEQQIRETPFDISVDKIIPTQTLKETIKVKGKLDSKTDTPITLKINDNGELEILDGHNRYYSALEKGDTLVNVKISRSSIQATKSQLTDIWNKAHEKKDLSESRKAYNDEKAEKMKKVDDGLVAVHNISSENLVHADKVGGLAVPSLGITKVEKPLESFGEISLLASKELIDPKKSAKAKVFDADIYSPRYPNVQYKLSYPAITRAAKKLFDADKKIGGRLTSDLYEGELKYKGMQPIYESAVAKYKFLEERGEAPDPVMVTHESKYLQANPDIAKHMGMYSAFFELTEDEDLKREFMKLVDALKEAEKKELIKDGASEDAATKTVEDLYDEDSYANIFRGVQYDIEKSKEVEEGKVDFYDTRREIEKNMRGLEEEFKDWVDANFGDIIKEERLVSRNEETGDVRTYPHTLDNAVRIMKRKLQDGEGFNYGAGSIRAKVAKRFKSIEDIQRDRDRVVSADEMEQAKADAQDALVDLYNDYFEEYNKADWGLEAFTENLKEVIDTGNPDILDKYYEGVSVEGKIAALEYLNALKKAPTEYFEAKIQRGVELWEFAAAVVPSNASDKVKNIIEKSGIGEVVEYNPSIAGDRSSAIKEASENMGLIFEPKEAYRSKKLDVAFDAQDIEQYNPTENQIQEESIAYGNMEQRNKAINDLFERFYTEGAEPYIAAKKMHNELKKLGHVNVEGLPIASVQDAAEVASMFRDPRVENVQGVFLKGGKVIAHISHTMNMPDRVAVGEIMKRIKKMDSKLNADGFYLAHNHPSGDIRTSEEDIEVTELFYKTFGKKMKGHIVLNGDRFAFVGEDLVRLPMKYLTDKPDYSSRSISFENPEHLASVVKDNFKEGADTIIFTNAQGQVISIDYVNQGRNLFRYIKENMRNYGASQYILASTDKEFRDLDHSKRPHGMMDFLYFPDGYDGFFLSMYRMGREREVRNTSSVTVYPGRDTIIQEANVGYGEEDLNRTDRESEEWGGFWDAFLKDKSKKAKQIESAEKKRKADQVLEDEKATIDNMVSDDAIEVEMKKIRYEAGKMFEDAVIDNGGIKPNENKYLEEEYKSNVPMRMRRKDGLTPDEMAATLSANYGYDFANDSDMYEYMNSIGIVTNKSEIKRGLQESKNSLKEILTKARDVASTNARLMKSLNKLGQLQAPIKSIIRETVTHRLANKEGKELRDQLKKMEQYTRDALREGRQIEKKKLDEYKEARKQERANRKLRQEFKKQIGRILSVKTDEMEDKYKREIGLLQEAIDPAIPSAKTVKRLENTKDFIRENPEVDLPDYVIQDLARLEKKNRGNITLEEMTSIADAVKHLEHLQKMKNKILDSQGQRNFEERKATAISEMKPVKEIKENIVQKFAQRTGGDVAFDAITAAWKAAKNFVTGLQDHWDLTVELIAGTDSVAYDIIYRKVKEGRRVALEYSEKYKNFFADKLGKAIKKLQDEGKLSKDIKDLDKWSKERIKVNGVDVDFSRAQRISVYLHSQNEGNMAHLKEGYSYFNRLKRDYTVAKAWKTGELEALLNSITDAEKAIARIQWELSDITFEDMNKVFQEKNRYSLQKVLKYFGIRIADGTLEDKADARKKVKEKEVAWVRPGLRKQFTKSRIEGAKQPLIIDDYFKALAQQIGDTSNYVGLEIPLSNASKLFFDKEFSNQLKERYGKDMYKHIEGGLRDMAGAGLTMDDVDSYAFAIKNAVTQSVFALNSKVWTKQMLSLPLFGVYVKAKYLIPGIGDYFMNQKKIEDTLRELSVEFRTREKMGFQQDLSERAMYRQTSKLKGKNSSYADKAMAGVGFMDRKTVAAGMWGAINQKLSELKDTPISAEEKMNQAVKFAEWVVNRTQPSFATEHLSPIQRSKNFFVRQLGAYGTATSQMYNLIRRTGHEYARNRSKENLLAFSKAVFLTTVVNSAGVLAVDTLWNMLFNPDFEEDDIDFAYVIGGLIKNVGGLIFGIREATNILGNLIQGGPVYKTSNAVYDLISDSAINTYKIGKGLAEGEHGKVADALVSASEPVLSGIYNLPGVERVYKGAKDIEEKYNLI